MRTAVAGHLSQSDTVAALPAARGDRAVSYLVAVLVMVAIPFGWRQIWRTQRSDAWVAKPPTCCRKAATMGAAAILVAGGIAMGWPPWWERLPGGYVVDRFESGITAESLAAAR